MTHSSAPEIRQDSTDSKKKFPWWALVLGGPVLFFVVGPCRYLVGAWLLSFAGPGAADYDYPLIGSLSLARMAGNMRVVGWFGDHPLDTDDEKEQYGILNNWILIDADVSSVGWTERYIVCFQADSPQADDRKTGWWIVDTHKRQRFGPMDEREFRSRVEKLGIADVQIESPQHWR